MEFQFTANKFVLKWLKKEAENKSNKIKFIDLACGNCQLLDYAKSLGFDVTGLDIKPKRKAVKKHDLNKKLKFADNSFDIVSCIDSLEHVRKPSNVFLEAYRILKKNGIFIVTVPNTRWYKNPNHISYFTYGYMKQLIKYSGFIIENENHFFGIPHTNKWFSFKYIPFICFHFVFKLRKF